MPINILVRIKYIARMSLAQLSKPLLYSPTVDFIYTCSSIQVYMMHTHIYMHIYKMCILRIIDNLAFETKLKI